MINFLYLCTAAILLISSILCKPYNPSCLDINNRISWHRHFHVKDDDIPIIIDVSSRSSHRIVSYIVKILLQERLGYKNVEFKNYNYSNIDLQINRLSCVDSSCIDGRPVSHINVEMWISPGYSVTEGHGTTHVIDCGPLGPTGRKGVFVDKDRYRYIFSDKREMNDDWRTLANNNCWWNVSDRRTNSVDDLGTMIHELYLDQRKPGRKATYNGRKDCHPSRELFVDVYPSVDTVQNNVTRVLFPDCWPVQTAACEFEAHQLTKVVSVLIRDRADKAFQLIRKLRLSPDDLVGLLREVVVAGSDEAGDREYYRVACAWLRGHEARWAPWTLGWDHKDKIYLPILVSDYAIWPARDTANGYLIGIERLNEHIFNDTHYDIVPMIHEVLCDEDLILGQYLSLIQTYGNQIMGLIVCLCPRTFNSLIKISDMQHRIILSSSMESTYNMNLTGYRYFFSTQPSMNDYNLFLIKMFHQLNWTRVVILKKDDHLLEEKILPRYNIKVLASLVCREDQMNYEDIYSFLLAAKREHKASIFIVDYLVRGTQITMCAASNLGMTRSKGYVFILNPLYDSAWLNNHTSNYCPRNNSISKEIFAIKHDTHAEHIDNYIRINVRKSNNLAQMTQDAVMYLGNSFRELIALAPSAYYSLQTPPISENFVHLLANRSQNMLGANKNYQRKIFNGNHERNGIWKFQQVSYVHNFLVSLSLFKWNINNGYDAGTGLPNIKPLYPFEVPRDRNSESDCPVELLRHLFGWSCTSTQIFINVVCIASIIGILIGGLMWYYRRQAVIMEDRFKKPFEDICAELADIDIRSSDVVISLQVGKGAFGIVYGGEAKRNNRWESVAIKLIKKDADYQGKIDFLTEAKLMRNLDHVNIVKLIGICLNPLKPAIYLVMELVVNGDLEDYLLTNRILANKDPYNKMVCPSLLTRFVKNIASGTEYLHQHSLLHRDLACRNFFLSEDYIVKIGDFGLTRDINECHASQYYRTTRHFILPARWMPPEAVQFGYFSVQSDIWSLGVVIFEIATFSSRPYFNVTDEEIPEHVKRNSIPLVNYLPESAADSEVYRLIEKCCQYKREERPRSMTDIVRYLEDNDDCIKAYITSNPPQSTSLALWNMNPYDNHQRPISMISGGLNRFKSTSRSKTNIGNWGLFSDSHNNCDSMLQTESDTGRVAFPCNPDQVPFIPSEVDFITVDQATNRIGSKKKHKNNKKLSSNLNSCKSRSSDFMAGRIDDDMEPSYVSCPDSANVHCPFSDIDIHDFPSYGDYLCRSVSGDGRSVVSMVTVGATSATTEARAKRRGKTSSKGKVLYKGTSRPGHRHRIKARQCSSSRKVNNVVLSNGLRSDLGEEPLLLYYGHGGDTSATTTTTCAVAVPGRPMIL